MERDYQRLKELLEKTNIQNVEGIIESAKKMESSLEGFVTHLKTIEQELERFVKQLESKENG